MPIDYMNGKIYKIVSNVTDQFYIGSTCQKLCQRLGKHRSNYSDWKKGKCKFISSFSIFDTEDFDIVLIEYYPCENKEQLLMRERYWIEQLPECVNINNPIRLKNDERQYYEENRENILKKRKGYYEGNKELILSKKKLSYNPVKRKEKYCPEKQSEYYQLRKEKYKKYKEDNKEKIKIWHSNYVQTNRHLIREKSKIYREKKKDELKIKKKAYRDQNKEILRKKANEKFNCGCGGKYQRSGKIKHMRTSKHQQWQTTELFYVLPFRDVFG